MPNVRQLLVPMALSLFVAVTIGFSSSPAQAAAFMKYDGIDGESVDKDHEGWIDVLSWSWGSTRPGRASRDDSGRPPRDGSSGDLTVTKYVDKSSPKLSEACVSGAHSGQVVIHLATAESDRRRGTRYMTYVLKDVMVTSCSSGGSAGEDRVTENVTLNFSQIEWTYAEAKREGSSSGDIESEYKVERGE